MEVIKELQEIEGLNHLGGKKIRHEGDGVCVCVKAAVVIIKTVLLLISGLILYTHSLLLGFTPLHLYTVI